eukprot:8717358-Pyramimonas_sp.AAC.1
MDAISVEVNGTIGHISRQMIDSTKHNHIDNRPQHRERAKAKVHAAGTTQTSSVSPQRIRQQQHPPGSWITVQTPVSSTTSTIPVERYYLPDHDGLPTVARDPVPEGDASELNAEGHGDANGWHTRPDDNDASPSTQDRP